MLTSDVFRVGMVVNVFWMCVALFLNNRWYKHTVALNKLWADTKEMKIMCSLHDEILAVVSDAMERRTMHTIKIRYLTDIKPIEVNPKGDWIDLRSAEELDTVAGEFYLVHLGIACKLPEGYEAHILPRSSSFKKWGFILTNSMGIIDETYCGENDEWFLPIIALSNGHIHKNDRICQFRIAKKQGDIIFDKVDYLEDADRSGFGSTGEN